MLSFKNGYDNDKIMQEGPWFRFCHGIILPFKEKAVNHNPREWQIIEWSWLEINDVLFLLRQHIPVVDCGSDMGAHTISMLALA